MPARHRSLHPPRFVVWLRGLLIQLKRGGLMLRRGLAGLLAVFWRFVRIFRLQFGRAVLRGRAFHQKRSAWTLAGVTGTLGILLMILLQLMYSFQTLKAKESPVPKVAGSAPKSPPDTRIDPGLPQGWSKVTARKPIAQIDPFVPEETEAATFAADPVDSSPPSPESKPKLEIEPKPEPESKPEIESEWKTKPEPKIEREPEPKKPLPPSTVKPEPFVDPLDNLPPAGGTPTRSEPLVEPSPMEPPPSKMAPQEFSPQNPIPLEPDPESEPPAEPQPEPPGNVVPEDDRADSAEDGGEREPFVDPLDRLPPSNSVPEATEPIPQKTEREPFVDPLDRLPPSKSVPLDEKPNPEPPSVARESAVPPVDVPTTPPVQMSLDLLRLPADDDERFLQRSARSSSRQDVSRDARSDAWDRHLEMERHDSSLRRSYWEQLSLQEREGLKRELSNASPGAYEESQNAEPQSELALAIEKRLPPKAAAHQPLRYEIVIENRGREMLESVEVDEAVPPKHQLTDVSPAGYFENHLLRWRLKALEPGEKRRLSVEVVPSETGTIETTTNVRPSASVGSVTQIEKQPAVVEQIVAPSPPLRLRRLGYKIVSLDESVLFTNHVENLADAPQRNVTVVETVPAGFRVVEVEDQGIYNREAGTIIWQIAALPAGETAKLGVRLQAEKPGELTSRVTGSASQGNAVPIRARVQAAAIPTGSASSATNCSPCRRPNCCCP